MKEAIERSKQPKGSVVHHANMAAKFKYEREKALQDELKRIEEAAINTLNAKDAASGYSYVQVAQPLVMAREQASFDPDLGYKKPRGHAKGGAGTYSLDDMKSEDRDPVWSAHYDDGSEQIFYYNRISNNSVWEKPADFDGYEIMAGTQARRYGDPTMREDYE